MRKGWSTIHGIPPELLHDKIPSGRGGKRKGAGRKPSPDKKISYATKLRPDNVEFLRGLKNAAKWLDEMIDKNKTTDQ